MNGIPHHLHQLYLTDLLLPRFSVNNYPLTSSFIPISIFCFLGPAKKASSLTSPGNVQHSLLLKRDVN
jgi:hypothetical protein